MAQTPFNLLIKASRSQRAATTSTVAAQQAPTNLAQSTWIYRAQKSNLILISSKIFNIFNSEQN
jgi:hypothetical protein